MVFGKVKKNIKRNLYKKVFLNTSIDKQLIIFESNLGRNYSGNPKAIYERMVERSLDEEYTIVWIFEEPEKYQLPGKAKVIKRNSIPYFYYMARAGFWVMDCRQPRVFVKRKGTTYIQAWHGTPLKKLGLDLEAIHMAGSQSLKKYKNNVRKDTQRWDYLISQNRYSTKIFSRAFNFYNNILETGYPRNDALVRQDTEARVQEIKKKFHLPLDKKIILYAPTWRDNQYYSKGNYRFDMKLDLEFLQEELGDDYIFLLKMHYLVVNQLNAEAYPDFAYEAPSEADIQELFLAADILITDYSSVMFDYSVLQRPMIFFAYDLEEYRDSLRGFYFDYEKEVPGPIVRNNRELAEAVHHVTDNARACRQKYEAFLEKFNPLDDGRASDKVIALLQKGDVLSSAVTEDDVRVRYQDGDLIVRDTASAGGVIEKKELMVKSQSEKAPLDIVFPMKEDRISLKDVVQTCEKLQNKHKQFEVLLNIKSNGAMTSLKVNHHAMSNPEAVPGGEFHHNYLVTFNEKGILMISQSKKVAEQIKATPPFVEITEVSPEFLKENQLLWEDRSSAAKYYFEKTKDSYRIDITDIMKPGTVFELKYESQNQAVRRFLTTRLDKFDTTHISHGKHDVQITSNEKGTITCLSPPGFCRMPLIKALWR
ncbi:CDP-glycerol glycerophosphotransferase family protein [Salibacterium aidingense]|uniref:CDP-glycerol glycerophosphotransferase family protein n=1 Tax=Salibacterium aidingense TaxID=384933 RepID=UPI000416886E|nr:CDP-glycerol glycerophosphotransferase family protein [Salibacterium aidingense]